jgi:hypothetical protein
MIEPQVLLNPIAYYIRVTKKPSDRNCSRKIERFCQKAVFCPRVSDSDTPGKISCDDQRTDGLEFNMPE